MNQRKKLKRLLPILLALALCVGCFSSCNKEENKNETSSDTSEILPIEDSSKENEPPQKDSFWNADEKEENQTNEPPKEEKILCPPHEYAEEVVSPTCEKNGYTLFVCKACGDSFQGEERAATGHTPTLVNAQSATCIEAGYTGDRVCSTCGVKLQSGTILFASGHAWKRTLFEEPTCTKFGLEVVTCSVCGREERRETPRLEHSYQVLEKSEPTCENAGEILSSCTACGEVLKVSLPPLSHTYEIERKEENGFFVERMVCTSCGKVLSESITENVAVS